MYEQGVSVSTRICPDCTHMTWCVGHGTSACASWSLGTCLAVADWCWHADGCEIRQQQQAAGAGGGWMLSNNANQGSGRGSSGVRSQALGIGDPDLMRRPLASRVMKVYAGCGHCCWLCKTDTPLQCQRKWQIHQAQIRWR